MGPKRLQFITLSSPKASKKKQTTDEKVDNTPFMSLLPTAMCLCKPKTTYFSRMLGLLVGFCSRTQCRRQL